MAIALHIIKTNSVSFKSCKMSQHVMSEQNKKKGIETCSSSEKLDPILREVSGKTD